MSAIAQLSKFPAQIHLQFPFSIRYRSDSVIFQSRFIFNFHPGSAAASHAALQSNHGAININICFFFKFHYIISELYMDQKQTALAAVKSCYEMKYPHVGKFGSLTVFMGKRAACQTG